MQLDVINVLVSILSPTIIYSIMIIEMYINPNVCRNVADS
jgi:hypothetical protein